MVKVYPDGVLTPQLDALRLGQTLEVSEPLGAFRRPPEELRQLVMLAAGTGLTPMVRLTQRTLAAAPSAAVRLLFFNRRERDVLWREQLERLAQREPRFQLQLVLSEPDEGWQGRSGRVSAGIVQEALPGSDARSGLLVTVCGPSAFSAECARLLAEQGVAAGQVHVFDG
ncbi:cytochrome b5 reductase 4-like [Pollicipes pollicipes]|uniref:cytochrome b5 reductase 4-like n=1 Tax=Pollicipes pollicipes TaxID=41117 RepID=UPI00188562F1|nr:cytochrome b5 reductase 4-like [Pollicipes pollicipes]